MRVFFAPLLDARKGGKWHSAQTHDPKYTVRPSCLDLARSKSESKVAAAANESRRNVG